jgi:hypothetical protein
LLGTIIIVFLVFFVIGWFAADVHEGFCNCHSIKDIYQTQSDAMSMSAINNTVSTDLPYVKVASIDKDRVYKYPHYYGMGAPNGFAYGEPYYKRN